MMTKMAVLGLYLLALLGIGTMASRRMGGIREYFAADKSLGFVAVAFSARATGESAWLLLGLSGMGAAVGVKAFWVVIGETLGVMGAWLLMCRRFKRLTDDYDAVTVPDYLESRFDDRSQRLRLVAAAALIVFVTIYVSAQIDATGQAFEVFLGWNYYAGLSAGFIVVLVYTLAGGFLAVVWSDVLQGALMFLGLLFLPIAGVCAAGGIVPILESLEAIDPALLALSGPGGWSIPTVLSTISLCLIGLGFLGSPQIFVRFIALKSEREIRPGALAAATWTILATSGAVLSGMIGRAVLTEAGQDVDKVLGAGGEDVLPMLVEHVLPLGLIAIFIAIVLSAIMSTVDSLLVLAASALVRDYYQQVRHPELSDDALVRLSRFATLALALAALAITVTVALNTPDRTVFWFVIFGWSGISATFCPTIILSLFWSGMTRRGALWGMLTGFLGVPLFKFLAPSLPKVGSYFAQLGELPPAFLLSGFTIVLVSCFDPGGAPGNAKADLNRSRR